jgi:3-oxoacyl-(acyl-carrier-protein) synthase
MVLQECVFIWANQEKPMQFKTVAVTGMGTVTRDAVGLQALWRHLLAGGALPAPPTHFNSAGFRSQKTYTVDPQALWQRQLQSCWPASPALYQRLPCAGYGWLAAREALWQARLDNVDISCMGLSLATTSGGSMDSFASGGTTEDARYGALSSAAYLLAELLQLGGCVSVFSCACVSGVAALSHAFERVRQGDTPLMLAGGCDQVREADFAGFNALRAIAPDACRPFDENRKGMVMGDGAAMLVLEDLEHAIARGARPLAIFRSFGLAADGHHLTAPNPDGLVRAMRQALARVEGIPGYINCHGTGTLANDSSELLAMQQVFGSEPSEQVVSSTKSGVGHLLGSAGALEAVLTINVLREQRVPPMTTCNQPMATMNFRLPMRDRALPVVTDWAMSNSLGFGGLNGSLIFSRPPGNNPI